MMKNVLLLLITLATFGCKNSRNKQSENQFYKLASIRNQNHSNYTLTGQQTGFDYEIFTNDTLSVFGLEFELRSKYDSLPAIYLMTCSWGSKNAVTNPSSFSIGTPCDANFWMPVKIKNNEILKLNTSVLLENDIASNEFEIQLGLVLVDTTEVSWRDLSSTEGEDLIRKKQELEKDVVWSNVIHLKKIKSDIKYGGMWELLNKSR